MGTHTLQHPLAEVESKAFNFMQFMCLIISGSNHGPCFIINMDQIMTIYFTMNAKKTFEVIGKKTINVCTSRNDTKRVTVVVSYLPLCTRESQMERPQQRSFHLVFTQERIFTSARKLPGWIRR